MSFFSEDSFKSTMRVAFIACVGVALLIAVAECVIWCIYSITVNMGGGMMTDRLDLSQPTQLVLVLLGVGTAGKVSQKVIEVNRDKTKMKMKDENTEEVK